ncbi:MAG TPA: HEPN domain-containing protein [Stellaceae bacterium]|nr:HEPN domain-containing protein [Stellaceae bacterium]
MTPETADYLDKARVSLSKARDLLDLTHYADEAARAAYLAGFHAAQALVFARLGRAAKTHSGLRSAFARLAKDDSRIEREFTRFLARLQGEGNR